MKKLVALGVFLSLATLMPGSVWGRGGGGCFPAGTPIETPEGEIAIEKLKSGDIVLGVNENGKSVRTSVEEIYVARSFLLILETDFGSLQTTAEHPLELVEGGFRNAGECFRGHQIMAWFQGKPHAATILEHRQTSREEIVFTLRVGRPHTFIASHFVVHNKGGGGGGGGGSSGADWSSRSSSSSSSSGSSGKADPVAVVLMIVMFGGGSLLILSIIVYDISHGLMVIDTSHIFTPQEKVAENLDYVFSRSEIESKEAKTRQLLEFIAKTDPSFAFDALNQVAQSTFTKLQQCWQGRAYDPMESLMMPDLYQQHCAQLRGMVRDHEINKIDALNVRAVDIVNVRYMEKEHQRQFTALITARARDYYVDDRTHEFVRGDGEAASFQEFWAFQRLNGAWLLREIEQSRESDALKNENFFEPFTDQGLKQVYAKTDSPGGPSGPWLESKTEDKASRIERLLNFLAATDKVWDRQSMIDRARKVFADVILAQEAGDAAAIPKDELYPEAALHLEDELRNRQKLGRTVEYRNFCVRKVELVLVRNFSDNSKDEFTTRISAHAQKIVKQQSYIFSKDDDVIPFVEFWTFGRLENQWKLKEALPPAEGMKVMAEENLDEDSSPAQVQWYYKQSRAV